jgi:hypothetical protein
MFIVQTILDNSKIQFQKCLTNVRTICRPINRPITCLNNTPSTYGHMRQLNNNKDSFHPSALWLVTSRNVSAYQLPSPAAAAAKQNADCIVLFVNSSCGHIENWQHEAPPGHIVHACQPLCFCSGPCMHA